jgi:cytoskeletal protein CcmA (bactofilin family)
VSDSKGKGMIDGFASVQALRRARDDRPAPDRHDPATPAVPRANAAHRSPTPPTPARPAAPSGGTPARIGHTALPTRHELVCYECRYAFAVTGRLDKVFCPKCRTELVTHSITVDDGWREDVKTVGTIRVVAQATLKQVELIGTDIIIAGDVTEATIKPTRRLSLDTGARVRMGDLDGPELEIVAGARLKLDAPLICGDLTIRGELTAQVRAKGVVTLTESSQFSGSLHAAHLVIEDGAGLRADFRIALPAAPVKKPVQEPAQDA